MDKLETFIQLEDGTLVERDALNIAEKIKDYDPNLSLQYLEQAESLDQPPFRVIEHCKDGIDRVVFSAWVLDDRIIERIYAADTQKFDIDKRITDTNAKAKVESKRRYEDKWKEAKEMVHSIIASPKDTYTVKIDDKIIKFKA